MNNNSYITYNNSNGGIGFLGLLTIVFITLKLCDIINWGWLWVLSPLWIPFAILIAFLFIALAISTIPRIFKR